MPRLNGILMALLAVAVIGTAVFLSLEKSPSPAGPDPVLVQKLLRKLSDSDPDIRREAEFGFKAMGFNAVAPLAEASKSADRRLAEAAARLLREVDPPKSPTADVRATEPPPAPAKVDPVELILVCGQNKARPDEPLRFYVRMVNHGTAPVLVARHGFSYTRFAWIEVTDGKGALSRLPAEPATDRSEAALDVGVLAPGETRELYAGIGDGTTGLAGFAAKDLYKVRFVYDASEESSYRKQVAPSEKGTLLPPLKLISNVLEIAVAD
jgi:hypothetical protein